MSRPRTVDPAEVVKGFRDGTFKYGSEAASKFGCSRVRINQILEQHAPDLLPGKVKPRSDAEQQAIDERQAQMRLETEEALRANQRHVDAAEALGLTASGLHSRMKRLGIEAPAEA